LVSPRRATDLPILVAFVPHLVKAWEWLVNDGSYWSWYSEWAAKSVGGWSGAWAGLSVGGVPGDEPSPRRTEALPAMPVRGTSRITGRRPARHTARLGDRELGS
jgi:hypothetical protein